MPIVHYHHCIFLLFLSFFFFFFFGLHHASYGILVPWPGIKPASRALEEWSLNRWTAREVPSISITWMYEAHQYFSTSFPWESVYKSQTQPEGPAEIGNHIIPCSQSCCFLHVRRAVYTKCSKYEQFQLWPKIPKQQQQRSPMIT